MFKRLIVPIVGNAASSVAVGFAIDIAKARGGDVTFCYALDIAQLGMGSSIDRSWIDLLRPDAVKVGNAALARAAQAGCLASMHIIEGVAEDVVLGLAASFDLVVIGTRAIHGVMHAFDHSVTDPVVRACTRPVLVIREWDTVPAMSPETAVFRRLIVPVDGSSAAGGAIAVAGTLASEREEEIVFVYVVDRARAAGFSGSYAFDGGGAFDVMRQYGTTVLAAAEAAARLAGAAQVRTRLLDGDPIEAILEAIADERGDAVVIGTHGRQGLDRTMHGSVTEELIRKSPVPVLALHAANLTGP
jgi:nucleotide-binding universal stress UspA family protein